MATKARQQYDADGISLQKQSREFSIEDSIKQKIDSVEAGAQVNTIETVKVNGTALVPDVDKAVNVEVPDVIDNLYSTSANDALSAKQGKNLYDYIQNVSSRGRFLSNWNSATGLPMTNPSESPYIYRTGDYYIVSNIASLGGTNYRPSGSSYIIGQASTVVETESVEVSDFYFYDGTNWLLLKNSARGLAIDSSLSTQSTNPVENRVITNALNDKANTTDVLTKTNTTSYIPTADYHPATKRYVDDASVTFKAFPNTFNTTGTTAQFLSSISTLTLPVGSAYLGQVSLSDMPDGVTVQGDVEVYIYPQNVIYAVMRSAEVPPYIWVVDSYSNSLYNRSWTPESNFYTGSTAPTSSATEGMLWYDTTNDVLKVYDGLLWNTIDTNTTYSAATSSTLGLVKLASDTVQSEAAQAVSSTANKTYGIQLNSSNQAVVNVPWTDTTYTASDFDIKDLTDSTSLRSTWSGKQDALVSGTNIKTINGTSVLGTGDIVTPDTTYVASDFDIKDLTDSTSLRTTWSGKQDALTLPSTPTQGNLVVRGANNKTLADGGAIPTGVPSGGTDGQVLSKVSGNIAWANPTGGGDVYVSSQANNIFTTGMKIWGGTVSDYESLTPDSNTAYLLLADSPTPPTPGWQPTTDCVVYYKFQDDMDDHSGNGYNITNTVGSAQLTTLNGVKCLDLSTYGSYVYRATPSNMPTGNHARTHLMWVRWTGLYGDAPVYQYGEYGTGNFGKADSVPCSYVNSNLPHTQWTQYGGGVFLTTLTTAVNTWYLIAVTIETIGGEDYANIYYNGGGKVSAKIKTSDGGIQTTLGTNLYFGKMGWTNDTLRGYLGAFVTCNTCWTDQQIQDYYDLTKGDYGIS